MNKSNDEAKKLRLKTGMGFFIIGCIAPFFAPLVFFLNIPQEWRVGIAAALVLGLPEILWIVAGVLMGKEAITVLKDRRKFWKKRE